MVVEAMLGLAACGSDGGSAVSVGQLRAVAEEERAETRERGGGSQRGEGRDEGYEETDGEYHRCRLSVGYFRTTDETVDLRI